MEDFQELFPKELRQRISPKGSVEMGTDLKKGAKPKIVPVYKLSLKLREEQI